MLLNLCRAGVEGMTDVSGSSNRRDAYKELVASLLALMISIVIIAFIGKWLWNTSVAELFTFVRPVQSIWQLIGLMIFISLFK
jgi:hypothetical protein